MRAVARLDYPTLLSFQRPIHWAIGRPDVRPPRSRGARECRPPTMNRVAVQRLRYAPRLVVEDSEHDATGTVGRLEGASNI